MANSQTSFGTPKTTPSSLCKPSIQTCADDAYISHSYRNKWVRAKLWSLDTSSPVLCMTDPSQARIADEPPSQIEGVPKFHTPYGLRSIRTPRLNPTSRPTAAATAKGQPSLNEALTSLFVCSQGPFHPTQTHSATTHPALDTSTKWPVRNLHMVPQSQSPFMVGTRCLRLTSFPPQPY